MKTDIFSAYVDIFLPIYNPADPGITDSSIPHPGIEKMDPRLQSLTVAEPWRKLIFDQFLDCRWPLAATTSTLFQLRPIPSH